MAGQEMRPGEWPDISVSGAYQRLVALAKRRLAGYESHAEDVVSRVLVKWQSLSTEKQSVARIEQVIKSEAYSLLRSEQRLKDREVRAVADPAASSGALAANERAHDVGMLRMALAETCRRSGIPMSIVDVEVLEMLLAGYNLAETAQATGLSIYEVKRSRARWRFVCTSTMRGAPAEDSPRRSQHA
jgi:DNA-directed RNA polymerase specialized sigma24 family protein